MKKTVAFFLAVLILNVTVATAADEVVVPKKACFESTIAGMRDADRYHSTVAWWAGGVVLGFLGGPYGTGLIWGVSFLPNPRPILVPEEAEEMCYRQGFKKEAKGDNNVAAGVGGLIGTALLITVVIATGGAN